MKLGLEKQKGEYKLQIKATADGGSSKTTDIFYIKFICGIKSMHFI